MSSPRFLLINPWIHDFAAFDLWLRPLGFLSLYSYLRKTGCQMDYIDALQVNRALAKQWDLERPEKRENGTGPFFSERIAKPEAYDHIPRYYRRFGMPPRVFRDQLQQLPSPDAVLLTSGMTYWYTGLAETVEVVGEVFPDVPLYLGGTYATLCPDHARANIAVDRVVPGQWETQLMSFLESEHGVPYAPERVPFARQPFPAMDLYPDDPVAVTRLTRGCPYSCDYCACDRLSGAFTGRGPERFAREVAWNVGAGRSEIALHDDALLVHAERFLIPALRRILDRDIRCRFHTPNGLHAKYMTPEIADLFRRANFETVRISFEAISGRAREASDGKVTPGEFVETMGALKRAGYQPGDVEVYTLIGLPGQTEESIRATAHFIHDHGGIIRTAQYSPVPGTTLGGNANSGSNARRGDPLLHNSTIAPGWDYDVERYDRLKNYTRELNRQLRVE